VLLSQDGRYLYATQPHAGVVTVMAARTGRRICSLSLPGEPSALVLAPDSNTLYVGGRGANRVSEVDALHCQVKHVFITSGPVFALALAFTNNNVPYNESNQLWVASTRSLAVFDTGNGRALGNIAMPQGPRALSIPPGNTVYATTQQGTVEAADIVTHRTLTLATGGIYGSMDFNDQTHEVVVADRKHQQLLVLPQTAVGVDQDVPSHRVIHLDAEPVAVAITSGGQLGVVALRNGQVEILDLPGRQMLASIALAGSPQFIITGLYPPEVALRPEEDTIVGTIMTDSRSAIVLLMIVGPVAFFIWRYWRQVARKRRMIAANAKKKKHVFKP